MMWRKSLTIAVVGSLTGPLLAADAPLGAPVRIEAGGKPIDVDTGHAAPLFADFDGDAKPDLLVGQFDGGKLRVYKNHGDADKPAFTDFQWFKAGPTEGTIPAS